MKRTKASLVIGSSLILATTIALIATDYFGTIDKPELPYLTVTSPERLPPDPTKPNGAEIRYTDVQVFGLVGGRQEKPHR